MNFNGDLISLVVFGLILAIYLYLRRDKLETQSIAFPLLYMCLYRTKLGLRLMDKLSSRYREIIKFLGLCGVGFAFTGLVIISYFIIQIMYMYFFVPEVTSPEFRFVLPGLSIPGVGYLTFLHWIIAIFLLAVAHEFAHGVVARAHDIKVKSSGFAFLGIIIPVVPAAFVEPDEKEIQKRSDVEQYSVFAAGPMVNIAIAVILMLIFPGIITPNATTWIDEAVTYPVGFSVNPINETLPAAQAGITAETMIIGIDGQEITDANRLSQILSCKKPGDAVTLSGKDRDYDIITTTHPNDPSKAYIGVNDIRNERLLKPQYERWGWLIYWLKELIKWVTIFNLFIGLINLLPIFITDGARMLQTALLKMMSNKQRALMIWKVVNLLFGMLFVIGIAGTYLF